MCPSFLNFDFLQKTEWEVSIVTIVELLQSTLMIRPICHLRIMMNVAGTRFMTMFPLWKFASLKSSFHHQSSLPNRSPQKLILMRMLFSWRSLQMRTKMKTSSFLIHYMSRRRLHVTWMGTLSTEKLQDMKPWWKRIVMTQNKNHFILKPWNDCKSSAATVNVPEVRRKRV